MIHDAQPDAIVMTPSNTWNDVKYRLAPGATVVQIDRYAPDQVEKLVAYMGICMAHASVRILNLTDAPELDTNVNVQIGEFYGNLNRLFTFERVKI